MRRAQVAELRASLDSAQKTLKDSRSWLARDPFPSLLERARRGQWAELDRAVGRAKTQNASKIERCAKASAKVDRAMNLRFDFAEGAKLFDEDTRRAIGKKLPKSVKESPSVKAFLAGRRSRFDPGDAATSVTAAALGEAWIGYLRRTAYLDRIRAAVRFNKPGPASQEVDADELVRSALSGLRDRLSHGATLAAATWADYMTVSASRALGDAITNAARLDGASLEESIAAADAIRELQWLIAALRNVQWRCLWPTFGDAAALHEGAKLTLRGEKAVQARGVSALARRRPRQGTSVAVVGTVSEVEITHEARGKAVTWLAVKDPGGEQTVSGKITGFKGDTTGLVVGSAARVAGTWRRSGDKGWIQVERRAISDEAKRSFRAFLEWETRKIWMQIPHGLMVAPGWVRGLDGPLNPVRYRSGHAD